MTGAETWTRPRVEAADIARVEPDLCNALTATALAADPAHHAEEYLR